MSDFFMKSILAAIVSILAVIAMFTMFEVFGRSRQKYDVKKLMMIHRLTGRIYLLLFIIVSYYCLDYIVVSRAELSSRSTFHGTMALSIAMLMFFKYLFIRIYREFYSYIKIIGLLMVMLTFVMTGISGGYYMLVSKFGTDNSIDKIAQYKKAIARGEGNKILAMSGAGISDDKEQIARGQNLYEVKCIFCHSPDSNENKVGPGMKGILMNEKLPISGRPATTENIVMQLKKPYSRMPSFEYLSDEEISDILAFLKTL